MKLGEVLARQHALASVAAQNRDRRVESEGLGKIASQEKDAGLRDAWKALVNLVKKPFVPSPQEQIANAVKDKLLMHAQTLVHPMPTPGGKSEMEFLRQMDAFLSARPGQIVEQQTIKRVPVRTQSLEKVTETKLVEVPDPETGKLMLKAQETLERNVPVTQEALREVSEVTRKLEFGQSGAERIEEARRILETIQKPQKSKVPMGLALSGLAGLAAFPVLEDMRTKSIHQKNLRGIVDDPMIPASHKLKAQDAFQILSTYSPSIAQDPIFSKDFVRSLIRYDSVDHKVVSDLIQAEKHFLESKGKKAEFLRSLGGTVFGTLLGMGG